MYGQIIESYLRLEKDIVEWRNVSITYFWFFALYKKLSVTHYASVILLKMGDQSEYL